MAQLLTTRNYDDGEVLTRADLDAFLDDIETFLNTTKINDDNIQNAGINGALKLLNQSVTAAKLASDAVTNAKIENDAVTTVKILDSNVTTAKINDLAVTTAKINDLAVTTGKIADDAVTNAKIGLLAVGTAELQNDSVTPGKLQSSSSIDANRAVTTDHIRNEAVTGAKRSVSYTQGSISRTLAALASVTNDIGGTIVSSGRPVLIVVQAASVAVTTAGNTTLSVSLERFDGVSTTVTVLTLYDSISTSLASSFNSSGFGGKVITDITGVVTAYTKGDATNDKTFTSSEIDAVSIGNFIFGGPVLIDVPAAGTWQYRIRTIKSGGTAGSHTITARVAAVEL